MSSKWTLTRYEDGDKTRSVTQVVTAAQMEMDKNRALTFKNGKGVALHVNKDEWISVQAEGAYIETVNSRVFGASKRARKSRAKVKAAE